MEACQHQESEHEEEDTRKEGEIGEEAKNGEEDKEEVSKEPCDQEEVNMVAGGSRPELALDEEEVREDTHVTPLGVQTLLMLATAVDADVEQTVDRAMKYTQQNKEVKSQKNEVIFSIMTL